MHYFVTLGTNINTSLNNIYAALTVFFQSINIDERLAFFCRYHLLISILVFLPMLAYFVFFDKKATYRNFILPKNLVIMLVFFGIYCFMSDKTVSLSYIGLGTITINPIILLVVAKLYGAIPAAVFGVAEYFYMCVETQDDPLMISLFFIYAIGGMLHGWILYEQKSSFWRCLLARVVTVILCNIILIPLVRASFFSHSAPISVFIPQTITSNILQIPIQTIVSYVALQLIKILRRNFDF